MQLLYEAGVDVPSPLAHGSNVILMEYIGVGNSPARHAEPGHAGENRSANGSLIAWCATCPSCWPATGSTPIFSAYNILYWEGQFKIIDFPQAVDPTGATRTPPRSLPAT